MAQFGWAFALVTAIAPVLGYAQGPANSEFRLAFGEHSGQLRWRAEGFKIIQTSAKPNGHEIGVRAQDATGRVNFLGFLFLAPEQAPPNCCEMPGWSTGTREERESDAED